jgi:hypothetical protein
VLSAWLATLHKDRFIERQPGTRLEWDGLDLLIRSCWFGSNLPAWARGVVSSNGLCSSGLVCAVCLVPLEVGPIVADPKSLAVTPYQHDPL